MPTPQRYANQMSPIKPMDGPVPGMTWDEFVKNFSLPSDNSTPSILGNVPGLGGVGAWRHPNGDQGGESGSGMGSGGFGGTYGDFNTYMQDIGDGTRNTYTRADDGGVMSHNDTINNDSWWDSTGFPLVASLGMGGALAGVGAFAGAAGASTGAFDLGGTVGGVEGAGGVSAGLGDAFGVGAGVSNTPLGVGFGATLSDGAMTVPIADEAAGAGAAAGAAGGGTGYSSLYPFLQNYAAPMIGTAATATQGFNAPSPQSSNPFQAISNLYNNGLTGGSASDYWQLANLAGGLGSALIGSNAAKTAAGQQGDAINNANALTAQLYNGSVQRNQPFLNAGTGAVNQQANLIGLNGAPAQDAARGQFRTDPGYDFAFNQGTRAVNSNAAAKGLLGSGRAMKDLTSYGQGIADQQYGDYWNRLSGLTNVGQNSANLTGQLSQNYGNSAANLLTAGGIAQSAGTMGSANAYTNALTQLLKLQQNGYYGG